MNINDFLKIPYKEYGRGFDGADCWGLVRLARVELFGRELLPSYVEISPKDKSKLTIATAAVKCSGEFKEVDIHDGAIVTGWHARLCVHVGIVVRADGRLWVLETNETTGAVLTKPSMFERRYSKIIYYDN